MNHGNEDLSKGFQKKFSKKIEMSKIHSIELFGNRSEIKCKYPAIGDFFLPPPRTHISTGRCLNSDKNNNSSHSLLIRCWNWSICTSVGNFFIACLPRSHKSSDDRACNPGALLSEEISWRNMMRDENRVISCKLLETTFKHVIVLCEGSKRDSSKVFHY